MLRLIYNIALWVSLPFMVLYLLHRARKQPEYLHHWSHRFLAQVPALRPQAGRIWVHAVSVGETHAVSPLVRAWASRYPDAQWVFSSTTPTGQATARGLFSELPGAVFVMLPYDLPVLMRRLIRRLQAQQLWLVETELWPNLLDAASQLALPVSLINARVSPRTGRRLQKLKSLSVPALARLHRVVCQTRADAAVFEALGRTPNAVVGNLKFDLAMQPELAARGRAWKEELRQHRVLLFASSREGEEAMLCEALRETRFFDRMPDWSLWVVPRHPQRCHAVFELLCAFAEEQSLTDPVRRSDWAGNGQISGDLAQELAYGGVPQIVLGDSMGEMPAYYSLADLALLGGSWQPLGGQNLIEACAYGCPVWMGPHTFNFEQVAEQALKAGAARRFETLSLAVETLCSENTNGMALAKQAALDYAQAHRGATDKTLRILCEQ